LNNYNLLQNNNFFLGSSLLNITKISIITFTAFSAFGDFYPYYTDVDSLFYGLNSLAISENKFEFSNELLEKTGKWEFVPVQWVKTIHDTAIPITSIGFLALSTLAYIVGGNYGLFYLGPIIGILFLIISERVSTKLFGKFVGLFTVVLLATDLLVYRMTQQLMTDNFFAIFIILGFFYFVIFIRNKKTKSILLCSVFLTIATFIRPTAIVFLPLEILVFSGYFIFYSFTKTKESFISQRNFSQKVLFFKTIFGGIKSKKLYKIVFIMIIPWLFFITFYFGYNDYFFGDPTTNYISVRQNLSEQSREPISLFLSINPDRFEFFKSFSVTLLPDQLSSGLISISGSEYTFLGANWLSIFSLFILGSSILISFHGKINRIEIICISFFIFFYLLFLTSPYLSRSIEHHPSLYLVSRYMIPMLPLSFMALGFSISRFFPIKRKQFKIKSYKISIIISVSIFIFISLLLISSIYYSPQVKHKFVQGLHIKDPTSFVDRFPLDREGLNESNIIVGGWSAKTIEYGVIPLFPYWDWGRFQTDTAFVPQEPIQTLKQVINDGYETFIFKGGVITKDNIYYKYLVDEHGFMIKNYSKTFCKLLLKEKVIANNILANITSDDTCYKREIPLFQGNQLRIGNRTINVEIVLP